MAELVGGAALGAVFGAVFAVLHDTVKNVGSEVREFKSVLTSLESKLDLLAPVVEEISLLNREEETKSLVEDMKKAEELIRIFSAMEGWTGKFQVHHSKQLTELEKAIENFCKVHMPAQTKRDTSQISQILEDTSQTIWEEFKAFREEHKLKKEKTQILLTPGQCSHTTSLEQYGRDLLIKGLNQILSKTV